MIGSKVKVKVTKRSKTYICDISAKFCPICIKPALKCAEFNSRSCDMPHGMVVFIPVLAVGGQRSVGFICLFVIRLTEKLLDEIS